MAISCAAITAGCDEISLSNDLRPAPGLTGALQDNGYLERPAPEFYERPDDGATMVPLAGERHRFVNYAIVLRGAGVSSASTPAVDLQDKILQLHKKGLPPEAILDAVRKAGFDEIDLDDVQGVIGPATEMFGGGRDAPIVDDDAADLARERTALNTNPMRGPPERIIKPTYGKRPWNERLAALRAPYERPWWRGWYWIKPAREPYGQFGLEPPPPAKRGHWRDVLATEGPIAPAIPGFTSTPHDDAVFPTERTWGTLLFGVIAGRVAAHMSIHFTTYERSGPDPFAATWTSCGIRRAATSCS
jgi:hypothetical protein